MHRILIIDDDVEMCQLLKRFLAKNNFEAESAHTGALGLQKLSETKYDLVLCDFRLGDTDGREMLKSIKGLYPSTVVIIFTGYSDIKTAVELVKLGAADYVAKPLIPAEVLGIIEKALSKSPQQDSSVESVGSRRFEFEEDYYQSNTAESKELDKQINVIAPTNYSVILYGESGTGKEVAAKMIHKGSQRHAYPFVALDCGTLTKELAGSELFGHEKGAFTGAVNSKVGHFQLADKGTLFLDEVVNLPYDVQASLLRVIQERRFKRVGGTKDIEVDVRIIVASNENLMEAYKRGRFREDLFHRFNEFSIHILPLRMRKGDIMNFANFFLNKANGELSKKIEGFDDKVVDLFLNYPWPGNLRELRNIVRRTALLTEKGKVVLSSLPEEMINFKFHTVGSNIPGKSESSGTGANLKAAAIEAELETIHKVLKQVNYNKTKAAKILNIDRKTLYNKIRNLNL